MRFEKRPQIFQLFVLMLAFLWAAPRTALAADPVVEWKATVTPESARAGEQVTIELSATVPETWHLYSMNKVPEGPKPLVVKIEGEGIEANGKWQFPEPHVEFDPNFKKDVEFYEGTVAHKRTYAISGEPGARKLMLKASGQICDPQTCLPVKTKIELDLTVEAGEVRPEHEAKAAPAGDLEPGEKSTKDQLDVEKSGLIGFLITAFLAGFGALATPCVFPMIPITIAFFTKHSEASPMESRIMAGVYCFAMVVCFTLLGTVVAATMGAAGMQQTAASIPFNIFMFSLLFLFGLSLMGLFEIRAPRFLLDKSSEMERKYGGEEGPLSKRLIGVFFMGMTFSLISFTCTVGVTGLLLTQIEGGDLTYPVIGMFAFGLAFSLPFFLLALFPAAAQRLQGKAGDWMVGFKVSLGFLEFAGAFKFLSNIDLVMGWFMITRPLVLLIWFSLFLACGLFLWRILQLGDYEGPRNVGVIRMLFGSFFVAFAVYSASGLNHTRSMGAWIDAWLPPAVMPNQTPESAGGGEGGGHEFAWIKDDIPGALAKGKAEHKPVFVDFTGYTCTNCRMMEASMFPRPQIKSRLDQMVLGQVYTDCLEDICEEQQDYQKETFDTVALPFYVVYDPYTGEALETFASSTNSPEEYEAFLQKGLDKFVEANGDKAPAAAEAETPKEAEPAETEAGHGAEAPAGPKFLDVKVDHARQGDAVDFELPSLIGEDPYKLSSDRGKWVMVNFWASWCAPCKHELEHDFPPMFEKYPDVQLVTVAFDGEDMAPVAKGFIEKLPLPKHPTLVGGEEPDEAPLPDVFAVDDGQLPQTYLIDPEGYVVWSRVGSVDQELLDRLLGSAKSP